MLRTRIHKLSSIASVYSIAAGGGGTTSFNPATLVGSTLSGGNLIISQGGSNGGALTIASHSTGKFYFEMKNTGSTSSSFALAMGLGNASANIASGPGSPDTNSLAYYAGDSHIYCAGAAAGDSGVTYQLPNDVVSMAVDIGGALIWVRVNGGNWNGSALNNPATGVGGIAFTLSSAPFFGLGYCAATGAQNTFNFGGSAFAFTAPVGFGNY